MLKTEDCVKKIQESFSKGDFDKFITDITFPKFKGFAPFQKIEFNFPVTIIVGPNGGGKSSILHAAWGMPDGFSTRDFWFSTPVDPIENEPKNPHRYWYSHYIKAIKKEAQSRKVSERKDTPGYWEPDRPKLSDGMNRMPQITKEIQPYVSKSGDRWSQVSRSAHYINPKVELSGFDRFFNHTDFKVKKEKQKFFVRWSKGLRYLIDGNKKDFYGRKSIKDIFIDSESLKTINYILNKQYISARYIIHNYYSRDVFSASVIFQTDKLDYSECFAGSGELAVVSFVQKLNEVNKFDLFLLDEPETSLHPGAQLRLIQYLLDVVQRKKIQVIISTHSPTFVNCLPENALVVLDESAEGIVVRHGATKLSAFFTLGHLEASKVTFLTEDRLLMAIVERAVAKLPEEIRVKIVVESASVGAQAMLSHQVKAYSQTDGSLVMVLDGDMKKVADIFTQDPDSLSKHQKLALIKTLKDDCGITIVGHPSGVDKEAEKLVLFDEWMRWCKSGVMLIDPYICPEQIFLELLDSENELLVAGSPSNEDFKMAVMKILEKKQADCSSHGQYSVFKKELGDIMDDEQNLINVFIQNLAAKIERSVQALQ